MDSLGKGGANRPGLPDFECDSVHTSSRIPLMAVPFKARRYPYPCSAISIHATYNNNQLSCIDLKADSSLLPAFLSHSKESVHLRSSSYVVLHVFLLCIHCWEGMHAKIGQRLV